MGVVKRIIVTVLLICIMLLPVACGSNNARIYVSLDSMPQTLDPQTAGSDSELLIARNIYEGLTRRDKDGKTVLAAAKSYDFTALTYTFTLRDDLKWSNGETVVADDFVFGIRRALLPETRAPFARLLYCIKGAKEVNTGGAPADTLAVTATDPKTIKIELTYDDGDFLKTLSMPVSMPCKEKFFKDSIGKYGLGREYVLSCGSYRIAHWNKAENGIRLYKNEEYTGAFKPKNDGVFIAKDKKKTVSEKLLSGDSDMALLPSGYLPDISGSGIKTVSVQNICWVLSLGGEFTDNIRQALCMCYSSDVYAEQLPDGFAAAKSVFPSSLGVSAPDDDWAVSFDSVLPQSLISEEIKNFKNKKFPQTTLIYSASEPMRPAITGIVGNWQKCLSAFMNIKPTDESLLGELKTHTLSVCALPVKADSTVGEYLYKFGVAYSGNAQAAYAKARGVYNLLPIAFEDTTVGYLKNISGVYMNATGGYIDFSYVVKK